MWWVYLCALDERCLVPEANRDCKFKNKNMYTDYDDCHRFDQSVINLVLSNILLRDGKMEYTSSEGFFLVKRAVTNMHNITTCVKEPRKKSLSLSKPKANKKPTVL